MSVGLRAALSRLVTRTSWLGPLWSWGMSIASIALGLLTLFVFGRDLPDAGWIVGYLLLLWLLFAVVTEARAPLEERGQRLVVGVADYTIQTLCHNALLFVLPAYYASSTLTSVNGIFLGAVGAGALLTAVDPWYRVVIQARPWTTHLLLGFSMFTALNVAFPLVRVPPIAALSGSAVVAGLALTPGFRRRGSTWRRAWLKAAALAGAALMVVWYGRALVPPAPLFLKRAVAAREVVDFRPIDEVDGSLSSATLQGWGGLVAYTAVHAPAGLRQGVEHVWWKDDALMDRIRLSPVEGGRTEGFRTYSRKTDLAPPLQGRYTVDVMTASGQLIGRLRFAVTP